MEKTSKQELGPKEEPKKRRHRKPRIIPTDSAFEGELIASPVPQKFSRTWRKGVQKDEKKLEQALEQSPETKQEITTTDVPCLVARSALILPFNVKLTGANEPINVKIAEQIMNREVKLWDSKSNTFFCSKLWRPYTWDDVPYEVADLNILFRQHLVGNNQEIRHDERTWTCRHYIMREEPRWNLFQNSQIHTVQNNQLVSYHVSFTKVELLLFPLGSLLVVIHVNWIPCTEEGDDETPHLPVNLSDVRTLLYVSKYRDKVESVCNGWSFIKSQEDITRCLDPRALEASLGKEFYGAKYLNGTISLRALSGWILKFSDSSEDLSYEYPGDQCPNEPVEIGKSPEPSRQSNLLYPPLEKVCLMSVEHTRHAIHHSTVVLDHEIPTELLEEYLFHLKRAFGQKNRPPSGPGRAAIGKVLVWRKNRHIGTSREGTVSLSWPSSDSKFDFEINNWYKKYQGIYLILFLYVLGERMVFLELSDLSASLADKFRFREDSTLQEMKECRDVMRNLATRMVRYTLAMCSDVGGISEYSEFFSSMRQVFAVPDLRNELSNELKDLLAAVESNYLEEERAQRQKEERESYIRRERQKRELIKRNRQEQQFAIVSSLLGALTIPFVLITGLFGMNLSSLPDPDFFSIILLNLLFSGLIFFLLMSVRFLNFSACWKSRQTEEGVV